MFSSKDLLMRVKGQQPFVPLRIVTTTGQEYEVHHPDMMMIGSRFLMLGHALPDNPSIFDQVTRVALIHVTELQDIIQPASPGNGAAH